MIKKVRGCIKLFVPYGLMVIWLRKRYGRKIDEPLLFYRGFLKRIKRIVKFMLPYGIAMRLRRQFLQTFAQSPVLSINWSACRKWSCSEEMTSEDSMACVDIVIPVYNGFEYLDSLFSSLKSTEGRFRLIVVNDCSPDARILPYLKQLEKEFDRYVLLNNDANLGFVQSVNRGLALAENDVVLLNTDVELPMRWLGRLMRPIRLDPSVATVTPFTNSGTICSFPRFLEDNDLPEGYSLEMVDAVFSKVLPRYEIVPTGVGFCMAMSKEAIRKVGLLDADAFGRGYGEENDWCQRAIKLGYRNVIAENLFVWHKHGGSFQSEEKKKAIEAHLAVLCRRYPNYVGDVQAFSARNPHQALREFAKLRLLARNPNGCKLIFDLDWGGGAEAYARDYIDREVRNGYSVLRVVDNVNHGLFIAFRSSSLESSIALSSIRDLDDVLCDAALREIVLSELVSFKDLPDVLEFARHLKDRTNAKLVTLVHDFYAVCPSFYLLNDRNEHCGYPAIEICRECIKRNGNRNAYGFLCRDIDMWRTMWGRILKGSDEVRCFSGNSRSYIEHHYGNLKGCTVVPHESDFSPKPFCRKSRSGKLVVATLGTMAFHKGAQILSQMQDRIVRESLPISLVHIGADASRFNLRGIAVHGSYAREDLPSLLTQYNVDVIFIASICPETFSYTTLEAVRLGYPVVCFDIGAPAERVSHYEKGVVIKNKPSADSAIDVFMKMYDDLGKDEKGK